MPLNMLIQHRSPICNFSATSRQHCKGCRGSAFKEADRLAKMAVQETGMGIPNHKKMKMK